MGLLHLSSQPFPFQNTFIRYHTIYFLQDYCNGKQLGGFLCLSSTTILRAKFWLPGLKETTKLSPFLVFPHTFFICYPSVDLFPGKQRHSFLLSKKSTAEVLYFFTVVCTVCILKVGIQFDVLFNVPCQSIKAITVKKKKKKVLTE